MEVEEEGKDDDDAEGVVVEVVGVLICRLADVGCWVVVFGAGIVDGDDDDDDNNDDDVGGVDAVGGTEETEVIVDDKDDDDNGDGEDDDNDGGGGKVDGVDGWDSIEDVEEEEGTRGEEEEEGEEDEDVILVKLIRGAVVLVVIDDVGLCQAACACHLCLTTSIGVTASDVNKAPAEAAIIL